MPPRNEPTAGKKRRLSEVTECQYCGRDDLKRRGFTNHERSCRRKHMATAPEELAARAQMLAGEQEAEAALRSALTGSWQHASPEAGHRHGNEPTIEVLNARADAVDEGPSFPHHADGDDRSSVSQTRADSPMDQASVGDGAHLMEVEDERVGGADLPEQDDIKIEYHPHSQRPDEFIPFDSEYRPEADGYTGGDRKDSLPPEPLEKEPWQPFTTRLDFDIAELMLQTRMNEKQRGRLISLIQEAIKKPDDFTLRSSSHLDTIWEHARKYRGVELTRKSMTLTYDGEDHEYEVWSRSLWEWCEDLLTKHNLSSKFHWDAERNYKFNGERYERFIDEPWTADDWWRIQSKLPNDPNAKPLMLIIYADKTRLSSFGTAKGYPVIARIANLPAELRNGRGIAGGRLVGWLPIEEEKASEHGKKVYVDFKRVIWHKGFHEILASIEEMSKTGFTIVCDDGIERTLYPRVLILSADYEEQCTMALVRGWGSTFGPCPVCLIPEENLMDLRANFPLRTTPSMQATWMTAQAQNTLGAKEVILKSRGLRDVENTFWKLHDTDVYTAISWDRLHAYHIGMFSDHLLPLLRAQLEGRDVLARVDEHLNAIAPWPGLNHFSSLSKSSEFADGRKHEDLSKVIIFAAQDAFRSTDADARAGYHALKLIRSYLELDMFASLTVQTESTITAGQAELLKFGDLVQSFSDLYPEAKPLWGFPKMHTHTHMFRDIQGKGVTRNYNTKYNEREHRPLKMYYRVQSNFKDVGKQISKLDDYSLIAISIRHNLDDLDAYNTAVQMQAEQRDIQSKEVIIPGIHTQGTAHVTVGSPYPGGAITLRDVQNMTIIGHSLVNFRLKLSRRLSGILGINVKLTPDYEITPYRYLRVSYECKVSWNTETDILRANPSFHNRPRYDFVLVRAREDDYIVGQLLYIFSIHAEGKTHYLALIHPFDTPASAFNRRRDADLQMTRVRARPRQTRGQNHSQTVFVNLESIIRGCLLVADHLSPTKDEYFIVNFIDQDMWMRQKSLKLAHHVNLE